MAKRFSDNLNKAASEFLEKTFQDNSEFSEDKTILVTAAFCIIEDKSYFNDIELINNKTLGAN